VSVEQSQMQNYPPRILDFRNGLVRAIPKVPNGRETKKRLEDMTTNNLILTFLTWRMRFVPAKPRTIKLWSGWSEGLQPDSFFSLRESLEEFRQKVERGDDLTPHLSTRVNRSAFVASSDRTVDDIDFILTKFGLHHFHVSPIVQANPKGRGDKLIFADVSDTEFNIFAVSDHDAFKSGSPEWIRLFKASNRYIQSRIPAGAVYIQNAVMASGHRASIVLFSDACDLRMLQLDPMLDDPTFVNQLYNAQLIERDGKPVQRPKRPNLKWAFNDDLNFGILDSKAGIFFTVYHYTREGG
jgi:hypothetical protein